MKITYDGTDVLICDQPTHNEDATDKIVRAVIACNEKAETKLYHFATNTLLVHGVEIGKLRTVFGLTVYAHTERQKKLLNDFIQSEKLSTYHGHI